MLEDAESSLQIWVRLRILESLSNGKLFPDPREEETVDTQKHSSSSHLCKKSIRNTHCCTSRGSRNSSLKMREGGTRMPMDPSSRTHAISQLRRERIARNWRQLDLAEQLGTTVGTIKRWERGSQLPGPYFRAKLCALFGKGATELGLIPGEQPI